MTDSTLLVVNSGSSSIKLALFAVGSDTVLVSALGERLNSDQAELSIKVENADVEHDRIKHPGAGHAEILKVFFRHRDCLFQN